MTDLKTIVIEPSQTAKAAVIWLHGLGASGNDFVPVVPELQLADEMAVRFIFPEALSIPVTINGGFVMPAWYDILAMDVKREVDETQLRASAQQITKIIDQQIESGIASDKIVVAGFSQGGAVAYEAALTYPKPLAGLLALSTYFATEDSIQLNSVNRTIPIRIMHGDFDPMVMPVLGLSAKQKLTELGYDVTYSSYPMEHNVSLEEIADISQWLQQILT
jgi:phospholipase/carboxylesterase